MVVELASSQIENHTQPDDHDNLKLIIKESNHQNVNTLSIHIIIMYNI